MAPCCLFQAFHGGFHGEARLLKVDRQARSFIVEREGGYCLSGCVYDPVCFRFSRGGGGDKGFFCFMASHFLRKFPVDLIGEFLARSIGCGAWRPCPPKLSRPGGGSPLRGRARAPWLRAGHTRMHGRAGERVTQGSACFSGHIWPVLRSPDMVLTWLKYTFSGFCFQWLAAIPF